jgi:hypothetical protein
MSFGGAGNMKCFLGDEAACGDWSEFSLTSKECEDRGGTLGHKDLYVGGLLKESGCSEEEISSISDKNADSVCCLK